MTPELRIACEIVFQEHKVSPYSITWNKDTFRGRISIGLCEMAKETLVKKNIIYFPNRAKKTVTILNPVVIAASTFEEAAEMIQNKVPSLVSTMVDEQPDDYVANHASDLIIRPAKAAPRLVKITGKAEPAIADVKWYMKPLFYYIVWPACAAVLGVLIAYLMNEYVSMLIRL